MSSSAKTKDVFGTFGLYRFYLSSLVMLGHLCHSCHFIAKEAVFVFYVLSAYVVCSTLCNKYLHIERGVLKFYANRILRIFPAYWVLLIPYVICIQAYPDIAPFIDGRLKYVPPLENPFNLDSFLSNIFLLPTTDVAGRLVDPQYIPATWSVGVELLFWLLVPALLLSRKLFWVAAVFTVIHYFFTNWIIYNSTDPAWERAGYFGTLAAAMPFLLGMAMYFLKVRTKFRMPHWLGILVLIMYVCFNYDAGLFLVTDEKTKYMGSMFIGAIVISYLGTIDSNRLPRKVRQLDMLLGHMSYGILLVHQLVGVLVAANMGITDYFWSTQLFQFSYPLVLAASLLIYVVIEIPVDRLRAKLRY